MTRKSFRSIATTLLLATGFSALAMAAEPMAARAATLVGTTTDPTGVNRLVVDGKTYDVAFTPGSYNTVFSVTPPAFLDNISGASDAAIALEIALNDLIGSYNSALAIFIPDTVSGGRSSGAAVQQYNGGFITGGYGGMDTNLFVTGPVEFGVLTAVPEPATWALLLLGFAGIGFMGYRRKSKSALMAA